MTSFSFIKKARPLFSLFSFLFKPLLEFFLLYMLLIDQSIWPAAVHLSRSWIYFLLPIHSLCKFSLPQSWSVFSLFLLPPHCLFIERRRLKFFLLTLLWYQKILIFWVWNINYFHSLVLTEPSDVSSLSTFKTFLSFFCFQSIKVHRISFFSSECFLVSLILFLCDKSCFTLHLFSSEKSFNPEEIFFQCFHYQLVFIL